MKVKGESEVAQSCPTLSDPMDCSLPGSSIHGIFQARVLECVAIAFSSTFKIQFNYHPQAHMKPLGSLQSSKLLELYYAQTVQDTILITTLQFSNQLPSPYLFFYFYSQSLFLNIILFYFILFFISDCAGSSLLCALLSSCNEHGLLSGWGTWASCCSAFSCCRAQALGCAGFSS